MPGGWVAIVHLGKGPQEGPREKAGESKLLAEKISTLNPKFDSLEFWIPLIHRLA